MTNEQLNETLITALQAMKILIETPRQILQNGDVVLKLGNREYFDQNFDQEFSIKIIDAKRVLSEVPEIQTLLEIRVLDMARNSATKRLEAIRGTNG